MIPKGPHIPHHHLSVNSELYWANESYRQKNATFSVFNCGTIELYVELPEVFLNDMCEEWSDFIGFGSLGGLVEAQLSRTVMNSSHIKY